MGNAGAASVAGLSLRHERFFDAIAIETGSAARADQLVAAAASAGYEVRRLDATGVGIATDELTSDEDVRALLTAIGVSGTATIVGDAEASLPAELRRSDAILTHPVFALHRSESEMLRYIFRLAEKDVSLTRSMIPLGSCTMKLNATTEMEAIGHPGFANVHPFSDPSRLAGYAQLTGDLESWLAEITGFAAVSLQPNAGSQGEYAGLLAIRRWHRSRGEGQRTVCLIPSSAHGTNPASAVMAGFRVVVVGCDEHGNVDVADLKAKIAEHAAILGALMVTYPSTHGVFEESIREICEAVHAAGGQVYMDGANMNAQVGLSQPGAFGADVCHLNLHKTFAIPHGGGGPGMGPIGVAKHLAPFLPGRSLSDDGRVSSASYGSASILPISWAYIAALGPDGLQRSTEIAILNANYLAARLGDAFPILYRGVNGTVAHECILDVRAMSAASGATVEDIAKRLMDFGFHAPTMSWPVAGTLMVEPTESESKAELDRFIDSLRAIRAEIAAIESGAVPIESSALRNAPHTAADLLREVCGERFGSVERAVAAGLAAAAIVLTPSSVSAAETTLVSATPSPNTGVQTSPASLSMVFSAPVGTAEVTMTCGDPVTLMTLGAPTVLADQLTVSVTVSSTAPKGNCNVAWKVTDLNLQQAGTGTFTFTITSDPTTTVSTLAGSTVPGQTTTTTPTTVPVDQGTPAPDDGTGNQGPVALFRLLSNLGLAVVFGGLLLITLAWPEGPEYLLTIRFMRLSWAFAVVASGLYAGALEAQQAGTPLMSSLMPTAWADLLESGSGKAAVLRVVLIVASGYAAANPVRAIDPNVRLQALLPPTLAVATVAFSREEFGIIEYVAGIGHALSMAAWLGGLVLLLMRDSRR